MSKLQCRGCEKRYIGCHSECEEYLKYKEESEQLRKARKIESEARAYIKERSTLIKHRIHIKDK